jgi:hypothetical protein
VKYHRRLFFVAENMDGFEIRDTLDTLMSSLSASRASGTYVIYPSQFYSRYRAKKYNLVNENLN